MVPHCRVQSIFVVSTNGRCSESHPLEKMSVRLFKLSAGNGVLRLIRIFLSRKSCFNEGALVCISRGGAHPADRLWRLPIGLVLGRREAC